MKNEITKRFFCHGCFKTFEFPIQMYETMYEGDKLCRNCRENKKEPYVPSETGEKIIKSIMNELKEW